MKGSTIILDTTELNICLRDYNKHTSLKVPKKQTKVRIHKYFLPSTEYTFCLVKDWLDRVTAPQEQH